MPPHPTESLSKREESPLQNVERRVLAVEMVCAAAAIDLRTPLQPAAGTAAAVRVVRERVAGPGPDRWLSPDLRTAEQLLADGSVLSAVEAAIGPLEVL